MEAPLKFRGSIPINSPAVALEYFLVGVFVEMHSHVPRRGACAGGGGGVLGGRGQVKKDPDRKVPADGRPVHLEPHRVFLQVGGHRRGEVFSDLEQEGRRVVLYDLLVACSNNGTINESPGARFN